MEKNRAPTMATAALAPDFCAVVVSPRSFSSLWDQARSFDWIGKDRIKRKRKGHASELSRAKTKRRAIEQSKQVPEQQGRDRGGKKKGRAGGLDGKRTEILRQN
jgi:hypothetical protein